MAAGFKYNPGAGVVTVVLERPLRRVEGDRHKYRRERWSMDATTRDVITVGNELAGVFAVIRPIDPTALLDMLSAGADDVMLEYYPDLAVPTTFYPFKLLAPTGSDLRAGWDRDTGLLGHAETTVHLRRTDGGSVKPLLTP